MHEGPATVRCNRLSQRLSRQRADLTEIYNLAYPREERRDGITDLHKRVALPGNAAGFSPRQIILLSGRVVEGVVVKFKIAASHITGSHETLIRHLYLVSGARF